ncbi:MAG: flagellar basal body L-ring protein FlgH [Candidatus Brocadiae bacterium]|nr:flagellar basal body L-ring protein FlgH [Candidatus Brocadiia bacterium]
MKKNKFLILPCFLVALLVTACSSSPSSFPIPSYPPLPETPTSIVQQDGSLYRDQEELYASTTAKKKGDVLTVLVQERHTVEEDGDVDLQRKSQTKLDGNFEPKSVVSKLPFVGETVQIEGGRESTHTGKVKYQKKSYLTDRLPVIVTEVRPDGLMVVWGKRQISLSTEVKTVALSGLIHPKDVSDDNTVYSDRIALATIHIEGKGSFTATTDPGTSSKTFQWILDFVWPF